MLGRTPIRCFFELELGGEVLFIGVEGPASKFSSSSSAPTNTGWPLTPQLSPFGCPSKTLAKRAIPLIFGLDLFPGLEPLAIVVGGQERVVCET